MYARDLVVLDLVALDRRVVHDLLRHDVQGVDSLNGHLPQGLKRTTPLWQSDLWVHKELNGEDLVDGLRADRPILHLRIVELHTEGLEHAHFRLRGQFAPCLRLALPAIAPAGTRRAGLAVGRPELEDGLDRTVSHQVRQRLDPGWVVVQLLIDERPESLERPLLVGRHGSRERPFGLLLQLRLFGLPASGSLVGRPLGGGGLPDLCISLRHDETNDHEGRLEAKENGFCRTRYP